MDYVKISEQGEIEFPEELLAQAGMEPGDEVIISENKKGFSVNAKN